jgi:hypothetical protein
MHTHPNNRILHDVHLWRDVVWYDTALTPRTLCNDVRGPRSPFYEHCMRARKWVKSLDAELTHSEVSSKVSWVHIFPSLYRVCTLKVSIISSFANRSYYSWGKRVFSAICKTDNFSTQRKSTLFRSHKSYFPTNFKSQKMACTSKICSFYSVHSCITIRSLTFPYAMSKVGGGPRLLFTNKIFQAS